jgi:hypothetical protein
MSRSNGNMSKTAVAPPDISTSSVISGWPGGEPKEKEEDNQGGDHIFPH